MDSCFEAVRVGGENLEFAIAGAESALRAYFSLDFRLQPPAAARVTVGSCSTVATEMRARAQASSAPTLRGVGRRWARQAPTRAAARLAAAWAIRVGTWVPATAEREGLQ